jgi:hypothetical protein
MEATAAGFDMRPTCLLVTRLGALQDGGDTLEVGDASISVKQQRADECVGGVADLAERDGRVFPPRAARSGGPGTND